MKKKLLIAMLSIGLTACGGAATDGADNTDSTDTGSGDLNNNSGSSSGVYQGLTTKAIIDNVETAEIFVELYMEAEDIVDSDNFTPSSSQPSNSVPREALNETETGSCGGTLSINGEYDDEQGDFDITSIANDYDDCSMTMDGEYAMEGNWEDFTLTFDNFNMVDNNNDFNMTMDGTSRMVESNDVYTTTLNIEFAESISGEAIKYENLVSTLDESSYPGEITITGNFYEKSRGYVTISTLEALTVGSYDGPDGGKLKLSGDNSAAYITFYSSGYDIEVDTDNDGNIDETDSVLY